MRIQVHKCLLLFALPVLFGLQAYAQSAGYPATWHYNLKRDKYNQYQLVFHLQLKNGWHIRAHNDRNDTLMMLPVFSFTPNEGVQLKGDIRPEGILETVKVDSLGMLDVYSYKVLYIQNLAAKEGTRVTGRYKYQVCNDHHCLAPKTEKFAFIMKE